MAVGKSAKNIALMYVAGEKKVITLDELEYEESSVDGLVLYQIASEPQFGRLMYKDQLMILGDGFTQPDLTARHIRY